MAYEHTINHSLLKIKLKEYLCLSYLYLYIINASNYYLLKFGGFTGIDYTNSIEFFDFNNSQWMRSTNASDQGQPEKRAKAAFIEFDEKEVIVFGG